VGKNPTDRGKQGVKKSLLVEADGGPLGIAISAANVNDTQLLALTLDAVVVERPEPTEQAPQNISLDKAYDNAPSYQVLQERGYTPHIRRIGEEKLDAQGQKSHPARRWVVERTWGWLSRWRGLLVRYDKKPDNYLAMLKLACALLWYRRLYRMTADSF
jgi:putative transposase